MDIALMILKYGGNKMFEAKFNDLNTTQKNEFSRIANKLLSISFLTKKKEDNKKDYYFIQNHKELFINYFAYINWELEIDEEFGVVHLNNKDNINRLNLKLNESIILLILRLLFHEKMQELSLANNVFIKIDEIHERYKALKIRDKMIDKTTLRNTLRLFKRYNLIDPIDGDYVLGDSRLIIYPTILLAVKVDEINKVYEKIDTFRKGGEEDEETYED